MLSLLAHSAVRARVLLPPNVVLLAVPWVVAATTSGSICVDPWLLEDTAFVCVCLLTAVLTLCCRTPEAWGRS